MQLINKNKENSLNEIEEVAFRVLDYDEDRNKIIERKSEILLGFLGIIIPIIIGVYYYLFLQNSLSINKSNCIELLIYYILIFFSVVIILSFIISAIFSVITILTKNFKSISLTKIWEDEGKGKDLSEISEVKTKLINHLYAIHEVNMAVIDKKAKILNNSFYCLIVGLCSIPIIFILVLILKL